MIISRWNSFSPDQGNKKKEEFLSRTITNLTGEELKIITTYFDQDMSLHNTCEKLFLTQKHTSIQTQSYLFFAVLYLFYNPGLKTNHQKSGFLDFWRSHGRSKVAVSDLRKHCRRSVRYGCKDLLPFIINSCACEISMAFFTSSSVIACAASPNATFPSIVSEKQDCFLCNISHLVIQSAETVIFLHFLPSNQHFALAGIVKSCCQTCKR